MKTVLKLFIALACILLFAGCELFMSISGSWSGSVDVTDPVPTGSIPFNLTINQSGFNISGPASIPLGSPPLAYTVSGTVSGTNIMFTLIPENPALPIFHLTGSVNGNTMSGTFS